MIPPMQYGGVLYTDLLIEFVSVYSNDALTELDIRRVIEPFGITRKGALFTADFQGVVIPVVPWFRELAENHYFFDSARVRVKQVSNWELFILEVNQLKTYYGVKTGEALPGHIKTGLCVGLGYQLDIYSQPKVYIPQRRPKARRMAVPQYLQRHYHETFD